MAHSILITGGSGYLGGTLLARLDRSKLPHFDKLYASVRTDEQAAAVQQYGALPARIDFNDEESVRELIIGKRCTVVFWLIDPLTASAQVKVVNALGELKDLAGVEVHFVQTSGAKVFSSHAGAPTDRLLPDSDPQLYEIQKSQRARVDYLQSAIETNNTVIDTAEARGVRSYIFVPCIVYGEGEGFGNRISIQTAAIVKAAKALRRVYRVDKDQPAWPVCHLLDNTNLYLELLRRILDGSGPDYGRNGYYLAASGSIMWDALYMAVASALAQRNVIGDDSVVLADDAIIAKMAPALGSTADRVSSQIGGRCTLTAERGAGIGWRPIYKPGHILEAADAEVELILKSLP